MTVNGICTDPDKVVAITASWYRRFILDYTDITSPLNAVLKKKCRSNWCLEERKFFDELKRRLTEAPALACRVFNEQFTVQTDASNVGLRAVLTQNQIETESVINSLC